MIYQPISVSLNKREEGDLHLSCTSILISNAGTVVSVNREIDSADLTFREIC